MRQAIAVVFCALAVAACRPSSQHAEGPGGLAGRVPPASRATGGSGPTEELTGTLHRQGADYLITRPDGSSQAIRFTPDVSTTVDGRRVPAPGSVPEGAQVRASFQNSDQGPVVNHLDATTGR